MPRRTGQTTRVINNAIETLFTKGEIKVPYITDMENHLRGHKLDNDQIILDKDDIEVTDTMQRHLLGKIMRRLNFEHGIHSFIKDGTSLRLPDNE